MAAAFGEGGELGEVGKHERMVEPKTGSDVVPYRKKVKRSPIGANGQLGLWLQFQQNCSKDKFSSTRSHF